MPDPQATTDRVHEHVALQDQADAFYERVDGTADPSEALVWTLRGLALEVRAHGSLMVWIAENRHA